jgi:general secretion pathway protein A
MYENFYGLRERPFDLTPNPRFLFMTSTHSETLSAIQYGISGRKGITLIVGAAGTGKTTLVHAALERQREQCDIEALYLNNPTLTRDEFYEYLALEFGLSAGAEKSKTRFLREVDALLRERQAAGVFTALIVDEAQSMSDELLEEVRLLANLETTTDKLLPVVMVGQSELVPRLNTPALRPLKQRIALRATLGLLNPSEASLYIAQRIRVAGGEALEIFSADALAAITEASAGVPRTISVICDNALVSGFAVDERPIGEGIIHEVCRDFDLPQPARRRAIAVSHPTAAAVPPPVARAQAPAPGRAIQLPAAPAATYAEPAMVMSNEPSNAPFAVPEYGATAEVADTGLMITSSARVLTLPVAGDTRADLRASSATVVTPPPQEPAAKEWAGYGKKKLKSVLSRMSSR